MGRTRLLAALVVLVLVAAACGGDGDEQADPAPGPATHPASEVPGLAQQQATEITAAVAAVTGDVAEPDEVVEGPEAAGSDGRSLSDAVDAVMDWLEVVASSASDAEVEAGLRDIATPFGVEATAAAAVGDENYVNHRTLVSDPNYAALLDSSLVAIKALSVRAIPLDEGRVETVVWYTLVRVFDRPGVRAGEASYYLSRFEFAFDEVLGWRLDSAAAGDEMRVAGIAPSVRRSADSAVVGAQETLAALRGHVAVRQLDHSEAGRR